MQEFLWEVWSGKRNAHHRTQMDLSETPNTVFQRLVAQLQGTDKEIKLRTLNPNTGKEVDRQWKFSCRIKGQTTPLQQHQPFAQQGVIKGALIVVRPIEVRANTIYIDGTEGLAMEEIAVAKNRTPTIIGGLLAAVLLGLLGFYFFYWAPMQAAKQPHLLKVKTLPESSTVTMVMDVRNTAEFKAKKLKQPFIKRLGATSRKNRYTLQIPKKAKIIYVQIEEKGHITWKKGVPLATWEKNPKQHSTIDPSLVLGKGFFPESLKKEPPKPRFVTVPGPAPKMVPIKYPRRWRSPRMGFDARFGAKETGPTGSSQQPASKFNLALALTVLKHFKSRKRRRYRVYMTRKTDVNPPAKRRLRSLRRANLIVQFDLASGLQELPKNNQKLNVGGKEVLYNDGVSGFQVFWSAKNKKADASKRFALCLGAWMKKAGFKPRAARKGEQVTNADVGVRPVTGEAPVLGGKAPAVRLVPGYITHRADEAALAKPEGLMSIARAIEGAVICFKTKK